MFSMVVDQLSAFRIPAKVCFSMGSGQFGALFLEGFDVFLVSVDYLSALRVPAKLCSSVGSGQFGALFLEGFDVFLVGIDYLSALRVPATLCFSVGIALFLVMCEGEVIHLVVFEEYGVVKCGVASRIVESENVESGFLLISRHLDENVLFGVVDECVRRKETLRKEKTTYYSS